MVPLIEVPDVVANKARAAGAVRWLDGLAGLVSDLEREWGLSVGRAYPDATEAWVAEARRKDGSLAVIKLLIPRKGDAAGHEITVLTLAGGNGCVRLLDHDHERGALLLERLGPSLHDLGVPIRRRHAILCGLARQLWRPAAGSGLPTGAAKGRWLAESIPASWEELDHPCSERAVAHALACVERRIAAHDDERAVLVHGDVHEWNALQTDDGFRLVDPDGLLAEAEYDMGILLREDPVELLEGDPMERARWLAARTGLDATAIWEWGAVERVSTGLLATRIGLQPVASQMLAAAAAIAVAS